MLNHLLNKIIKKNLILGLITIIFPICTLANTGSYLPLEINNQTAIAADNQIYLFIKGQDSNTGKACVMQFNQAGYGKCIPVTKNMNLDQFNYKLIDFPVNQSNTEYHQLFIPKVISGRIYFSIANPMVFYVDGRET